MPKRRTQDEGEDGPLRTCLVTREKGDRSGMIRFVLSPEGVVLSGLRALGLDLATVNATIATAWGGSYVNDFIDRGRVKRVFVQADEPYRLRPEDIASFYVRGEGGQMAPFTAFSTLDWANAPVQLTRYNGQPAMQIQGSPAPGVSTGAAMDHIAEPLVTMMLTTVRRPRTRRKTTATGTPLFLMSSAASTASTSPAGTPAGTTSAMSSLAGGNVESPAT